MTAKVRKIGLFGGTFDPVHYGHLMIAEEARTLTGLDEIIFIPAGQNPFKPAQTKEEREHCYRMLMLATGNNSAFRISRIELDKPGKSFTVNTVRAIQAAEDAEYSFIIGSDLLYQIDTWREAESLLRQIGLIVVMRPDDCGRDPQKKIREIENHFGTHISCIEVPMMGISSTDIRRMTAEGKSVRYYTPDQVIDYIQEHHLYTMSESETRTYNINAFRKKLKKILKPGRYEHTLGVTETAEKLAKRWGADPEKAKAAGMLHDCAKAMSLKELQKAAIQAEIDADPMMFASTALLHAPVGAWIAEKEYGVTDPEVLSAIASHTVGKPEMSLLDKIIFLSDYIEPGRDFPGVEKVREEAVKDLDRAVLDSMSGTISHLAGTGALIHPRTVEARNALINEIESRKLSHC